MIRLVILVALLALVATAAAAPAHAAGGARLAEAAGTRFPERAFALTLPAERTLSADEVRVREDGRPVARVSVEPADGAAAYRFGAVLVLDTSSSMRGRPLHAAIAAARDFVRHRRRNQPIAVMTFARDVRVVQPFTIDGAAIDRALRTVEQAGGGSRMLDAALQAVGLIERARIPAGSVVLLSDGADRGSRRSVGAVAGAARAANARVFAVGLRSASDDFGALNLLAAASHGEFSSASSIRDLARIYDRLGSRLAHQYVVRYRSAAKRGSAVRVSVRVDGLRGVATAAYRTPSLPVHVSPPVRPSAVQRFWEAPAAMVFVGLFAAALVGFATWLVLQPRGSALRDRMAAYIGATTGEDSPPRRAGMLTDRVLHGAGRSLEKSAWWARLREELEIARIAVAPRRLALYLSGGTLLLSVLLMALAGTPVAAVLAAGVPAGAWAFKERRLAAQRKKFTEQLPDNLQVIASAMRAGHSFVGALSVVAVDAAEPARREFDRVIADERLGVPVEVALSTVARRMLSKDLEQVALVAGLQRETGGNTAEVLDRVTENVRQQMTLRRLIQTLTAQGRLSRWVLSALPVVLLAVTSVLNRDYVRPMFETTLGRALLLVAAVMVVAGSLVIKKIVNIKV
jgi:tight adherence protein B